MAEVVLEITPVFTRWQVSCRKCGTIFYVDTETDTISGEILKLEDLQCGLHPNEDPVIELA